MTPKDKGLSTTGKCGLWNAVNEKGQLMAKHERARGQSDEAGGDPPQSTGSTPWNIGMLITR
jgi:hypothetical protein